MNTCVAIECVAAGQEAVECVVAICVMTVSTEYNQKLIE